MRRLIPTWLPIVVIMLSWQARATVARQPQASPRAAASDVKLLWQFEAGG
jgi:hypothetical protein